MIYHREEKLLAWLRACLNVCVCLNQVIQYSHSIITKDSLLQNPENKKGIRLTHLNLTFTHYWRGRL